MKEQLRRYQIDGGGVGGTEAERTFHAPHQLVAAGIAIGKFRPREKFVIRELKTGGSTRDTWAFSPRGETLVPKRDWVSVREAAEMLGCHHQHVHWLIREGRIPSVQSGGKKHMPHRIRVADLAAYQGGKAVTD